MLCRNTLNLLVMTSLVIGVVGCANTSEVIQSPGGYVFQHSMLNFSRVAAFPKRFLPPQVGTDNSMSSREVSLEEPQKYEPGDWASEERTVKTDQTVQQDSETAARLEDSLEGEQDTESGEIELARASDEGNLDLGSILGEREEERSAQENAAEAPLSLGEATPGFRKQVRDTALTYVGVDGEFDEKSFVLKVLTVNELAPKSGNKAELREVYKEYRNRGLTFDGEEPTIGDLVFFHNTKDLNRDSRNNDWYSACGVVTDIEASGIVTFVASINGKVQKFQMNLDRPEVRRDESAGTVMNSHLRNKSLEDPEFTQYLAGELFAGFVSLPVP